MTNADDNAVALDRLISHLGFQVLIDKRGLLKPGRGWRQIEHDTLLVTQAFFDKLKGKGDVTW